MRFNRTQYHLVSKGIESYWIGHEVVINNGWQMIQFFLSARREVYPDPAIKMRKFPKNCECVGLRSTARERWLIATTRASTHRAKVQKKRFFVEAVKCQDQTGVWSPCCALFSRECPFNVSRTFDATSNDSCPLLVNAMRGVCVHACVRVLNDISNPVFSVIEQ